MGKATNQAGCRYALLSEAAVFLGWTEKALRKRVERRQVPFRKMQKRVVFDLVELQQWVERLPGVTVEEALNRRGAADDDEKE